jgi:hypothetical protein
MNIAQKRPWPPCYGLGHYGPELPGIGRPGSRRLISSPFGCSMLLIAESASGKRCSSCPRNTVAKPIPNMRNNVGLGRTEAHRMCNHMTINPDQERPRNENLYISSKVLGNIEASPNEYGSHVSRNCPLAYQKEQGELVHAKKRFWPKS